MSAEHKLALTKASNALEMLSKWPEKWINLQFTCDSWSKQQQQQQPHLAIDKIREPLSLRLGFRSLSTQLKAPNVNAD